MKKTLKSVLVSTLMLLAFVPLRAQRMVEVTGVVSGSDGESLIGASIIEKGTTNGVITDFDGNYSILVTEGADLEFSCIGYVSQVLKAIQGKLDVVLTLDNELLEEVVVVGYGVQKKSSLTGAVSSVKSEDMQSRTITNANQALQGKTAGVQVLSASAKPGASPSVRIRGVSSNGDSSPLYVVDGRIASDIGGLDPNDIESMEVLKDGASAAIYGAAAGNGVILITTKKGKGDGRISYEYQLTSQSLARVPKTMNSEQYIEYFSEPGLITLEQFYKNWDFKTNTDWAKAAFENSLMHRHNASFMAGNDKGSIYVSLSYLNNNGIVAGNSDVYERLTGMINASWKIKKWLEIGTNNQIEHYKQQSVGENNEYGSPLLSAIHMDPLTPVSYTDGVIPEHVQNMIDHPEKGEVLKDKNGHYYGISAFISANSANPLVMRDTGFTQYRGFNINGTTFLNLSPIKELVLTSRISYRFNSNESYGVSHDYQASMQQMQSSVVSVSGGSGSNVYYQWENFLNFNKTFKESHNLGVMIGMSFSQNRTYSVNGSMTGKDDKGFKQDNELFWYWAYATATATKTLSGAEPNYGRKLAYFGRASYDYQGKYLAQVSFRADAADSSVLPVKKRWGFFPAASLGWTISRENFMEGSRSWLDMLKIRASWGQNGSTASLGGYRYANVIASTGSYPISNGAVYGDAYAPTATGNDELKWETSEQFNVGIDARFFKNRLTASADYYIKNTKDLIVTGITPSTIVGNTASPVNAGNISNSGFEFEIGWNDSKGDFTYGIRANIATLKNKVTYIHPSLSAIDGTTYHTYGAITRFEVGKPAWYFYGYKSAGIDKETGNPLFYKKDGTITDAPLAEDKTMIGKGMADFTYGLTFTAGWKGIDFILFGTGSQGNDIFCCLNRTDYNVNKLLDFTENRWKTTNTAAQNAAATRPRAGANGLDYYMVSNAMVYDGSYFKIKQIQLGYSLPKKALNKIFINSLRIYASLEDFFTFTKYPGFDPEVTGVGSGLGVDKGTYPNSRKVVFGVNVTF
ncbi:MAG: SusC/RagA family TonB-linked outer membrane protein [Bacteroidales bacterium]|nr:SusC/RagA family TonB-linked outer membrane protein [Bacteroidales bacterium]